MTVLGGVCVIATFLIRDVEREKLKTQIDSLSSAQTTFKLNQHGSAVGATSRSFEEQDRPNIKKINAQLPQIESWLYELDLRLKNAEGLLTADPQAFVKESNSLTYLKGRKDHFDEFESRLSISIEEAERLPNRDQESAAISIQLNFKAEYNGTAHLAVKVGEFEATLVARADEAVKAKKEEYEKYTRKSAALYCLGVVIAVFGHLIGAEAPSPDGD